jgi:hypothetical protein
MEDSAALLGSIAEALNDILPTTHADVSLAGPAPVLQFTPPGSSGAAATVTLAGSTVYILRNAIPIALLTPASAPRAVARELLGDAAYRIVDGTFYSASTPTEVIQILERSRRTGERLRLHLGDATTGRDWLEEHDVTGRVGRSTGRIKIPLLLVSSRSHGGGGILDDSIVRIRAAKGGAELYRHPLYHVPPITLADYSPANTPLPYAVNVDGKEHARFKSAKDRSRWFVQLGIVEPS